MSTIRNGRGDGDDRDVWAEIAEHEDTLEMLAEEDVPFAKHAETLLAELEEEGYR